MRNVIDGETPLPPPAVAANKGKPNYKEGETGRKGVEEFGTSKKQQFSTRGTNSRVPLRVHLHCSWEHASQWGRQT